MTTLTSPAEPTLRPRNADWHARRQAATPRGVAVLEPFFAARALNAELWDVEGRRYIDFASGIAVLNTGHRHPRVQAALQAQLEHFHHTAYQIVPYPSYVALAERINALAPGDWSKKTAFFTTGAEAVENAIKIARAATGRSGVIAFEGGFHGRTMMGMALTGKVAPYKLGFGPFPAEIHHAPFPSEINGIDVEQALDGVQRLFRSTIDPGRVAAFIYEPVQGEGGFTPAPEAFIAGLRRIADQHGILLIADEIQTGFARTGQMFASHHHQVPIDLICFAKSLAGGLPLSGVVGRSATMDAAAPGGLGGTYAGNPLAVAAAHAVLDVIAEEGLCERAELLGRALRAHLTALQGQVPALAEIRGLGSMVAAEFRSPLTGAPDAEFTRRVQANALESGLILLTCGTHGNVIRFLHPLTTPSSVFDEALGILSHALTTA
ncbi:4-aminobutyrate--2-oxoglutarate transaminase [Paucibacter sp. JuS9]|uniref:4-aminobutyrate--2-oxoglutarate transaminase n=1 Tax=Paucibacter sp. JuS9 TaxID=3228748 RepID=UPI0037568363